MVQDGVLAGIGGTPVVKLGGVTGPADAEIWVKLESANPTASYKDRMAAAMIIGATKAGRLMPGQTVVEYTGGSTGTSLALACAVFGHPLRIVTSDAFSAEKIAAMRAFGADVEVLPCGAGITPDLMERLMTRAAEVAATCGGYRTDQFHNTDMLDGYASLGAEAVQQIPGPIDAFCGFVGTGGCFIGAGRALRRAYPDLLRVAVEPAESPVLSGGPPGTHQIEGGGVGFRPPLLRDDDVDEVVTVSTAEACDMARAAARKLGIFSGPSTGANLAAAYRLARRLGPDRRVLTVQVDSGLKYLSNPIFAAG